MEKGTPVKVRNEEGVVNAIFDNFDAIPEEYVNHKTSWWDCQDYPYKEDHKNERWIAIDYMNPKGQVTSQGIYAEHRVKVIRVEA